MTSRNIRWNDEMLNEPFLLYPEGKDYLWGGTRLNDDFEKGIDLDPLAETWECSTHPDGPSIVVSGVYRGQRLNKLLKDRPDFLGTHPAVEGELPILIKFIDANKDLSVQVHPDDEYANKYENGQLGKTEMWYVLDAAKDAHLCFGLSRDMSKEKVRKSIEEGKLEQYLQKVPVKKNDVFYIEAGTIHAIGAGTLVAEIQENSNLTYRMYDYDRVDKNGNKRELHVDKALEVANLKASNSPRQPMRVLKYSRGCATEFLCRCKYFQVERMLLNTERCHEMVSFRSNELSFQVYLCIDGCGTMFYGAGGALHFFKGDCIFVPANSVQCKFHGQAQLLKVTA